MRSVNVDKAPKTAILDEVGLTAETAEQMYRLLAIAKYEDRYVIPTTTPGTPTCLHLDQGRVGFPLKGGS